METTHSHTHPHPQPNYHPPNDQEDSGSFGLLKPLRRWVDGIKVTNFRIAHILCQVIPCCCPFERDVNLFGWTLHIPPLCKLNPLYDEFVYLRFRALSYLADECGEDVTRYIC
ncbi:Mo-dependent nitrogenase C-terminal domain-containing protein [Anabaena sp. WFMT]|uniref:Mo-dependent nitrogenase C-terminal domain-containing protein n=1 Tax=Anabaena sp. WFMT TaxID=3449730 RepID=UPI003F269539